MRSKTCICKTSRFKCFCQIFLMFIWIGKFSVCGSERNDGLLNSVIDDLMTSKTAKESEFESLTNLTGGESIVDFPIHARNYSRPSVPKCCDINYAFTFENKSVCVESEDEFLPDFEDWPEYSQEANSIPVNTRYEYFIGDPCSDGKYILDLTIYSYDKYSIYSNGTLFYIDQLYSKSEFCLESVNGTIRVFVCFAENKTEHEIDFTFILYATGLIISIPFLVATAIIYLSVDFLRDLRGKSLSCHVLCLATGYFFLAVVQLASDQLTEEICIGAGFVIQFFFVAAFFWLNVISYDTWRCINTNFGFTRKPTNSSPEKFTFYYYSLYGWYGPLILSIVSLVMDLEPAIPESFLKPNFGLKSCWFDSDDSALPYFYGPVGIIICVNLIFFILSVRKIYLEKKKHIGVTSEGETRDKIFSITLYIKTLQECFYLFCIMGINWAAEIISWAAGGSQTIWLVTDLFNALQGVMIFYLFVVKPPDVRNRIKNSISKKWEKIVKCNCRQKEETGVIRKHWHANIHDDTTESRFQSENEKFIRIPTSV